MSVRNIDIETLRARMTGIGEQLTGDWSSQLEQHLHLDRDTAECAYWHSGYHQALADIFRIMDGRQSALDTSDTSNLCRAAG
ncbi:hypothetical protein DLM45_06840 [Hyphomicrobium methylovorum]|uniref:hypothetical protein n=1 Tax=Hyphomicrobium methylovorum TaxID=84 RepID=UPI0015E74EEF|nr:hypothetical protein [Hyphomicrobium methylovorum]MBA2125940.1 hypothetical protein [Hyphomicrobium methylovorum]